MPTDFTFKQICDFIKKDDSSLIATVDNLLNLAFACSPLLIGPSAEFLLPIIPVKDEIVKISKNIFETFTSKKDNNYLARQRRMEVAYGLICFTAFFEALEQQIPEPLNKKVELLRRKQISREEFWGKNLCIPGKPTTDSTTAVIEDSFATLTAQFPHPVETLNQQIERNAKLWDKMTKGFRDFIHNSAFWEEAKEKDQAQILSWIEKIPQLSAQCFEAQYFELVRRYEDFAVWANLHEHQKTKELINSLSEYVQQQAALVSDSKNTIDIGLEKMHDVVLSIPETLSTKKANEIAGGLKRYYDKEIYEPIAEGTESQESKLCIHFPRICDAFIPQSFHVLRWTSEIKSLEDKNTWKGLERREDLGAFLLSYLSSPFSTEAPLIILGHPGSGKSLLTKVLSAKLMSKYYTIIRVPLREVNAEADVASQIEERIRQVTSDIIRWPDFSNAFKNNPPLVILDGYDELLQASGKVFSRYLHDVKAFQESGTLMKRPVRVIVTSRITLIDKATIPIGATIVRLLEFDKRQRDKWISIWNQENASYFKETMIKEFALPIENEDRIAKILSLAEQPLLLLMLALYDSEENQLFRKSESLDRTILYNSLLRRFVKRERDKDRKFQELEASDQEKELDSEMQRLGVAALGMYNRRKLHILSHELNEDIKFFGLERQAPTSAGRLLTQADLLLGSFFFVHKSKAQVKAGVPEHHEEMAAFEFLHNTFGEFLTAEFIIRQVIVEVSTLKGLRENEYLRVEYEKRLLAADGLFRAWFASLVYTPLFTRPVVLEMMREWIGHALKRRDLSKKEFLSHLDIIVMNEIKRLLSKREFPPIMCKDAAQEGYRTPFGDYPLLGHIAIYSINLILLRAIVSDEPFEFDESLISTYEDGARPWDRLTHIWRSWFSLDNLNGITSAMFADRRKSQVTVHAKKKFQVSESQNRLETFLNVSVSLGDNISSGITGLLLFKSSNDNQLDIEDIARRLESERIDAKFQIKMKELSQAELNVNFDNIHKFSSMVDQTLEMALWNGKQEELEYIVLSLCRVIKRLGLIDLDSIIHPRTAVNVAVRNPQAALLLLQLAKEKYDTKWSYYFIRKFFEISIDEFQSHRIIEYDLDTWTALLQLAREIGGESFLRGMDPDFFERIFDPRYMLKMSQRSPEAALSWVQLAKEIRGENFYGEWIQILLREYSIHAIC